MASPGSPLGEANLAPEPAEFNKMVDGMADQLRKLFEVTSAAAGLPRGKALEVPGIGRIGKREVKSLQSQWIKSFKGLKKNYRARGQRKKKDGAGRVNNGFRIPMYVNDNLVQFFRNADLGGIDPTRPVGPQNPGLTWNLSFLGTSQDGVNWGAPSGITTSAMLTPLFAIYAQRNRLQANATQNANKPEAQWNNQFLGADGLLTQVFGTGPNNTFERIRNNDLAKIAARGETVGALKTKDSRGNPYTPVPNKETGAYKATDYVLAFEPNNFRYANFQSIASQNRIPKDSLDADQAARVEPMAEDVAKNYQGLVNQALQRQVAQSKAGQAVDPIQYQALAMQAVGATDVQQLAQFPALLLRMRLDAEQQIVSSVLAQMRERKKAEEKAAKAAAKAAVM